MTKKKIRNAGVTDGTLRTYRNSSSKTSNETFGTTFTQDENSLLLYLQEINRIPLLNKEEEERTARLAAEGNRIAKDKLVSSNLRFVIMVAKKYQGKGLPLEDLIGEGNIGLLNAVKHFDAEKGYRFITYAVWWIRQAIIKAIHEKGRMIRLPSNKANSITRIKRTRQVIQNEPGRGTGVELREVAAFLDMAPEKAEDLISISQDVISLDDPVSSFEDSLTIKDYIEDEYHKSPVENAMNSILKDEVEMALNGLEKRAAEVLRSRFGLGETGALTLKEVGDRYNLSRERVRQIEKRALGHLEQSSHRKKLESYIA